MTKGIHDPWRTNTPLTPEAAAAAAKAVVGTKTSDHPLDRDLRQPQRCMLRVDGIGGISILHTSTNADALNTLVSCILHNATMVRQLEEAGFLCFKTVTEVEEKLLQGFLIKCTNGALCAPRAATSEQGLRALILAVRQAANLDPAARQALKDAHISFIIG